MGHRGVSTALIEFEVKARIPSAQLAKVRAALGAPRRIEEHEDAYYQHPSRDFAKTDEALRVSRRGTRVEVTYKGPKLDRTTKARREITLRVEDAQEAEALVEALGFTRAMVVRKSRSVHRAADFEVALDEVPPLGWFVELERALPDDAPREGAERDARALLASWGIEETERASYLELLRAAGRKKKG